MPSFSDALDTSMDEIERPKPMPIGHYRWQLDKVPTKSENATKEWEFLRFQASCLGALDDVDADSLKEWGGDPTRVKNRVEFVFNTQDEAEFDRTMYYLKVFLLEHCQVEADTVKEAMAKCVGCTFVGEVQWDIDDRNPEDVRTYAKIKKTMRDE